MAHREMLEKDRLKDGRMSVGLTEWPSPGRGLTQAVALAYIIARG
jgi:hypothetical protein